MKEYRTPEMEIIDLSRTDVIVTSDEGTNGDDGNENLQ